MQGSGKTHTMRSVMRQGAAEIFSYIKGQPGREFVLRMSAMEIYNEVRAADCAGLAVRVLAWAIEMGLVGWCLV